MTTDTTTDFPSETPGDADAPHDEFEDARAILDGRRADILAKLKTIREQNEGLFAEAGRVTREIDALDREAQRLSSAITALGG